MGRRSVFGSGAAFWVWFSAAELLLGLVFGSGAVFWVWFSVAELFSGLDFGSEAVYLWSAD